MCNWLLLYYFLSYRSKSYSFVWEWVLSLMFLVLSTMEVKGFSFFEWCSVCGGGVIFCRVPFLAHRLSLFFLPVFLFPSQAADVKFLPGAVLWKIVFLVAVYLRPQKAYFYQCLSYFFLFFFAFFILRFQFFYLLPLFLPLRSFLNSYQLLLNYILLYTQNTFVHLLFCSFTAQKYPMVHLLQKGDNSFNQELLKNMVKSIKMNDVYGPMSQILDTLNKCPHFKRQR